MWHIFACTHHQSLDQTEKELKYLTSIMYTLTYIQRCGELTTIVLKSKGKTGTGLYMLQNMPQGILPLRNDVGCTIATLTARKKLCGAFQEMKHPPHLQAFCILKFLASVFFFLWQVSLEEMRKTIVDFYTL
jgi:hypothetical protein